MKKCLKIYFATAILLLCTLADASAQGKIYTKRARLEDFPAKTTKIVTGGNSLPELSLREEIITRWRISPFEFCTPSEFEELRTNSSYYFLYFSQSDGIMFLTLAKGGKEDETDSLKKPFEVVSMPIASVGDPSGRELMFMGAFVDIIQNYVEDAMISESTAYNGLKAYNSGKWRDKTVILDSDKVDEVYPTGAENTVLGLVITPTAISRGSYCYKLLISADTNELFYYKRSKYRGSQDNSFTPAEIRKFTSGNGDSSE